MKDVNSIIANRKSCRSFLPKEVDINDIYTMLESARWAPSGKNGQPWRFVIVKDCIIKKHIAECSKYKNWMVEANAFIIVYLDKEKSYHYKKDLQGIGAAIENICLQATALGIGSCWIGEIIVNEAIVNKIINVPKSYELMAVICIGYEKMEEKKTERLELDKIIYQVI